LLCNLPRDIVLRDIWMPTKLPPWEKEGIRKRVITAICGMYTILLVVVPIECNAAVEPVC